MRISGMMEEVNEVGSNHSFQHKYLSSVMSCYFSANPDFLLFQPTNISVFYFSFKENHKLLDTKQTPELSPAYFHIVIIKNSNAPMPKKVLIVSLVVLFVCGAVVLVIFTIKQGESINLDKAQQTPNPIESDWKIWKSSDFGPDCDSSPYCYNPLKYSLGIEFMYPPEYIPLGYYDLGGGLRFGLDDPINYENNSIAIDCTTQAQSELVEWLFPRFFLFHSYTLIDKKDIQIGAIRAVEAIFEVKEVSPADQIKIFRDRIIRFKVMGGSKVCEIQAPIIIDRDIVETIISSVRIAM